MHLFLLNLIFSCNFYSIQMLLSLQLDLYILSQVQEGQERTRVVTYWSRKLQKTETN